MENRKLIIFLLVIISGLFGGRAFAYEIETHRLLAKESLELFKKNYSQFTLDKELEEAILVGSEEEDDGARFLFHFFDPINNRGLKVNSSQWLSAKEWAQDGEAQLATKPVSFLANIFRDKKNDQGVDFTWQRALGLYRQGEKEKAFLALGHILHLLQDMTVPDHTRNDQHLLGSHYERFVKNSVYKKSGGDQPLLLGGLDEYFNYLSKFSNGNFYSQDTIGLVGYGSPAPDYFKLVDGVNFGVKEDDRGRPYFLMRKNGQSLLLANKNSVAIDSPLVLNDYWRLLSPKAVTAGAGLIDLFYKELGLGVNLEKQSSVLSAVSVNNFEKELAVINQQQGQLADLIKQEKGVLDELAVLLAANNKIILDNLNSKAAGKLPDLKKEDKKDLKPEIIDPDEKIAVDYYSLVTVDQPSTNNINQNNNLADNNDEFNQPANNEDNNNEAATNSVTAVGRVLVSRFLFDAEGTDDGKEFVEICNTENFPIDLSSWSLQTSAKKKNFEVGHQINAKGSFLIWFGENVAADMEWKSGSLKNAQDIIYLVNDQEVINDADDQNIINSAIYQKEDFLNFTPGQVIELFDCPNQKLLTVDDEGIGGAGAGSESHQKTAFLKAVNYYKNPANDGFVIDLITNEYPLNLEGRNLRSDVWKVIAIYKDGEPLAQERIGTSKNWLPDSENLLLFSYPKLIGNARRQSLVLPDTYKRAASSDGIANWAYNFNYANEDKIIRLFTDENPEFLTLALYDFFASGGGQQQFALAVIDLNKYYLSDLPDYVAPEWLGDPELNFLADESAIRLTLPKLSDVDSLDKDLIWEVNGVEVVGNEFKLDVRPNDELSLMVKAKDEWGNYSVEKIIEWRYPETELLFEQANFSQWGGKIGSKPISCSTCAASIVEQIIKPDKDWPISDAAVRLRADFLNYFTDLRLRILDADDNNELAVAYRRRALGKNISGNEDFIFNFETTIKLEVGKEYKLILEVDKYHSDAQRPYYESELRIGLTNGGGWYLKIFGSRT